MMKFPEKIIYPSLPNPIPVTLRRVKQEALVAATDYAKEMGWGEIDLSKLEDYQKGWIVYGGQAQVILMNHLPWQQMRAYSRMVVAFETEALVRVFLKCGIDKPYTYIRTKGITIGDIQKSLTDGWEMEINFVPKENPNEPEKPSSP